MKPALAPHRLRAQRLAGEPLASPADVVGHLGAVQSQLHDMALWAIGRRCGATSAEVEDAFARADFIRTHVLRPTWHDVLRADLPDFLELTAPRIRQAMASNNRRDGLERDVIERWAALAVDAVREHGPLTRLEVEQRLAEDGFVRHGNSLAHVMIEAELTGEIHSGPVRGKQHTYIPAHLPPSRRTPDERLAWLAQTYGRGHGPFRAQDLAWWSTLTLTQARHAIELAELRPVGLAGETYYVDDEPTPVDVPAAMLLPNFDEFISYARDPDDFVGTGGRDWGGGTSRLEAPQARRAWGMLMRSAGLLFVDGALAGSWTRSLTSKAVTVEVTSTMPLTRSVRAAIESETERFGAFVNRPVAGVTHALG